MWKNIKYMSHDESLQVNNDLDAINISAVLPTMTYRYVQEFEK